MSEYGLSAETSKIMVICEKADNMSRMPIEGSEPRCCVECGAEVTVSPATLEGVMLIPHGFICVECLGTLGKVSLLPATDAQIEELRDNVPPGDHTWPSP